MIKIVHNTVHYTRSSRVHNTCTQCAHKECAVARKRPGLAHAARTACLVVRIACASRCVLLSAGRQVAARCVRAWLACPGRDAKARSRRQGQVATSFPTKPQASSRLHSQVATSWTSKPSCYVNPMSRPPFRPTKQTRLRPQNKVVTPISNRPGRDLKMGSRPQWPVSPLQRQISSLQAQPGSDTNFWSQPQAQPNQVATSNQS